MSRLSTVVGHSLIDCAVYQDEPACNLDVLARVARRRQSADDPRQLGPELLGGLCDRR